MTSTDLIIFDCDGVLVDSEIIAARVEAELLTLAGFEITPEELSESYAGLTFKDIMLRIEEKSRIPLQASLIDQAEALTDKRLAKELLAIDGAREAVASVSGLRCVCSNSSSNRLGMMLGRVGLKPYFEGRIFSALETPSGGRSRLQTSSCMRRGRWTPIRRAPSSSRIPCTALPAPRQRACGSSASPAPATAIPVTPMR